MAEFWGLHLSASVTLAVAAAKSWMAGTRPAMTTLQASLHAEQFDVEDQRRVRRDDAAGAARAVAELAAG